MTTRAVSPVLAGWLVAGLAGCGADPPCPVAGQVLVNDRPAAGVYVVFHPAGGPGTQSPAASRTDKGGAFALQVAAPGEYAVTAFRPKVTVEKGDAVEGDDVFKGRYRDPARPVQTVRIQPGENPLPPIKLKAP